MQRLQVSLLAFAVLSGTGLRSSTNLKARLGVAMQSGPCKYQLKPSGSLYVDGNDRLVTIEVTASYPTCQWETQSYASWIRVISPGPKKGTGSTPITLDVNEAQTARSGTVLVASDALTIVQAGGGRCLYSGTSGSTTVEADATSIWLPINVLSRTGFPNGCRWKATSKVNWIRVTNSGLGNLYEYLRLALDENLSQNPRTGTIDISGDTFTLIQRGYPVPSVSAVVNAASFDAVGGVAPGSLFSIFGNGFGTSALQVSGSSWPTVLGNISVLVDGRPAPLYYAGRVQINGQIPRETPTGNVLVTVRNGKYNVSSLSLSVWVRETAPGLFQFGNGRAVVQNQDYTLNTAANPAPVGTILTAYLTGEGPISGVLANGQPAPAEPLIQCTLPVRAAVGSTDAEVLFAGLSPGFIGLFQVNFRVPSVASGGHLLGITVGSVTSNTALISVLSPESPSPTPPPAPGGPGRGR